MKSIKAKVDFTLNGRYYRAGEDVRVDRLQEAIKLNELGFIEPLSTRDLNDIKKDLENKREQEMKKLEEESKKEV